MTNTPLSLKTRTSHAARPSLGERVRQLRINQGLTQTDLAGERFSKEYVSQIERGKTRPTGETVTWLAERLNVDAGFLLNGVSSGERERVESVIARAEAALESYDYAGVAPILGGVAEALARVSAPDLELRALTSEAWAQMYLGEVRDAIRLLERARQLAEDVAFTDVDRADVLFRLGACRYNLSSIATSVSLLTQALKLADESEMPCDRLRSLILEWRSRCYQRQRDFEAAREDIERALELANGIDDRYGMAQAHFQASLVAERQGRWVLSRTHAEQAKTLYEEIAHQTNVGKLLNNLGGLNFLLGKPDEAIAYLKELSASPSRSEATSTPASPFRRSRRCISAPASSSWPRSRRVTRSSCSTAATTTWTRSATRSSSWAARSSSRAGSTRRRRCSPKPSRASASFHPQAIGRRPGSQEAISRPSAARTVQPQTSTGALPKRSRTSTSNRKEVTYMRGRTIPITALVALTTASLFLAKLHMFFPGFCRGG